MRPCIVIPGIKGSSLENYYPLSVDPTWSAWDAVVGPSLDSLALAPGGEADLSPTAVNRAHQLLPIAYSSFVGSLRGRSKAPVYVFPYDWRLSNAINGRRLVTFVKLLQKKPLGSVVPDWATDKTFDFACHSMGGLVFRAFLGAWTAEAAGALPVNRVAFVATPHFGSVDAVEGLLRGETALFEGKKVMRKLARSYPGVYELLPRFPNAVVKGNKALDIFDLANWQSNALIASAGPDPEDVTQLKLTAAEGVLESLPDPMDPEFKLKDRVLVVLGSRDDSTMRTVKVLPRHDGFTNWYKFDGALKDTGDEVVLEESARLPGAPFVRIPYSAVSYLADYKARFVSFHAFITELDEVQTVVGRFFEGLDRKALLPASLVTKAAKLLGTA